jgi:protocatechuate 3,4-dioxygenase beta subunit
MTSRDLTKLNPAEHPAASPSLGWSRYAFLRLGATAAAPLLLAACGGPALAGGLAAPSRQSIDTGDGADAPDTQPTPTPAPIDTPLPLTPANVDEDDLPLTPPQTEGPYFKRNSPERTSLVDAGMPGTRLLLTGRVLTTAGQPVARALLDFWQADARGAYDNAGYLLRGHQFADDAGQYHLETVVPGLYPGRTRHIHVKVQAPNGPILTTQLYFPDEPRNAADSIFDSRLVLPIQSAIDGLTATFDFVVQA